MHPGATPPEFDTPAFKPSKAQAVKMRALFLCDGGFCGKRYGFHVGLDKLVEIFRGEFSNFKEFSSALLKQQFEPYHLSKDQRNLHGKQKMHFAFNEHRVDFIMLHFVNLNE